MNKTFGQSVLLFLSMLVVLILNQITSHFVLQIKNSLAILPKTVLWNLEASAASISFITALIVIGISWKGHLKRLINLFFPLSILIFGGMACVVYSQSAVLKNQRFLEAIWIFCTIMPILTSLIAFGFANQVYTCKTAALQYPILIFIVLFGVQNIESHVALIIKESSEVVILGILAGISFLFSIIYSILYKTEFGPKERVEKFSSGYLAAFLILMVSITYVTVFPNFVFRLAAQTFATSHEAFTAFFVLEAKKHLSWGVYSSLLGIVLGILLYFLGKKRVISYLYLFVFALMATGSGVFFVAKQYVQTYATEDLLTTSHALFDLTLPLFLLIPKELSFFAFPEKSRFTAKALIDLIGYPAGPMLSIVSSKYAIKYFGKAVPETTIYAILFGIGILIAFLCIHKMKQALIGSEKSSPVQKKGPA